MKDGEEVCGHGWEFSQIDGEGEKTYVCGCPDAEGGQEVFVFFFARQLQSRPETNNLFGEGLEEKEIICRHRLRGGP